MMRGRSLDVAIIGMACRFPGARDLASYWQNLVEARDCISDVPRDRWDPATFYDPDSRSNDRVYCQRGGYLDAPIEFDPARHGVLPMAVAGGEPEQYLVLDATRAALADAGLSADRLGTRRVEVIIGRGNYFNRGNLTRLQHGRIVAQTIALLRDLHPDWDEATLEAIRADLKASLPPFEPATITGQLTNATAGRVANRLDLTGASYVIDAASASSLVALDQGTRTLVDRRADLALVGGVYLAADVDFPMVFCQLGALSRQGRARPFCRDADGTLPGEGVGVLVLKRLVDAERDGDRIYSVVKGVGLASDGRRTGLATPSARGHARAIRRAYRQADIDPATVELVEGHGLGVPTSDRAELRALNRVFPRRRWGRRSLGSVSSLIGHAMPAAGMAALIKTALSLHNRVLPAEPGGEDAAHPLLADEASPFARNTTTRPWIHGDRLHPRRAGVNAFGFAGISAHAVLEEYSPSADGSNPGPQAAWDSEAILLGAPDRAAWIARAGRLIAWLDNTDNQAVPLKDLAFTLSQDLSIEPFRVGLVVKSPTELRDRLEAVRKRVSDPACQSIRDARGTYFWDRPAASAESLAFLFPGEGSQYPGMLADLCPHFPEVRALFDTADWIAREREYDTLPSEVLFGGGAAGDTLWSVGMATNVVLSAQWALYQLLVNLGLCPHAVLGHSSGEFLALAAAGALSVDRKLESSLGELGRIFEDLEASGRVPTAHLVAIAADRERVERIAEDVGAGACIAIDNCPHQVVLAGDPPVVDAVVTRLRAEGVLCEVLPFDRAYHTERFAATLEPIRAFFATLPLTAPRTAVYSCAVARRMSEDVEELRRLAVEQWVRPVAFRSAIEAMYRDGIRTFVEVGARGSLTGFVDDILRDRPHFAVAVNLPRRSGLTQLNHLVASLYAQGIALRPDRLYERRRPVRVDLDRDLAKPPAKPALAVGFPEMSLSAELAAELRNRMVAESPAPEPPPLSTPAPTIMAMGSGNGHVASPEEVLFQALPVAEGPSTQPVVDTLEAATTTVDEAGPDGIMLEHLRTMEAFLETQRQVMRAYQAADAADLFTEESASEADPSVGLDLDPSVIPGPWIGTIQRWEPGREMVSLRWLEWDGDPVAEHHTLGGRRISALEPSRKGLPVVPFTVMAEMLAQAAGVLMPHAVVVALRDVLAMKWIRYESEPVELELRAWRDESVPDEVRVVIANRGTASTQRTAAGAETVVEGRVVFGDARPDGPMAGPFTLESTRPCHFPAEDIYPEQWLFHGPAMQAIVGLGRSSPQGIEGTLRVLPRRGLLRDSEPLTLSTDPIVLDAFTQLLGCWGMDQLDEGHVIFPLRVAEIALYGEDPPEGAEVDCRIAVLEQSRHLVRVDAEIVQADGRVWMAIRGWEDWRFYWPTRCRDHFRHPGRWFMGEPLPLPGASNERDRSMQGVWFEPPADFGKPIWRDVLEWVQLGPEERAAVSACVGSEREATLELWRRVAAKEAIQRWLKSRGAPMVFPADMVLELDAQHGERSVRFLGDLSQSHRPLVAMASSERVALALATFDQGTRPGVALVSLENFPSELPNQDEGRLLEPFATSPHQRLEWMARLSCAKQAYLNAMGGNPDRSPCDLEVSRVDDATGEVFVALRSEAGVTGDRLGATPLRVVTARRGEDHVWAWTVGARPA